MIKKKRVNFKNNVHGTTFVHLSPLSATFFKAHAGIKIQYHVTTLYVQDDYTCQLE